MSAHLRYDSKTGEIVAKSDFGRFTAKLLQLNDEASIRYRLVTAEIVANYEAMLAKNAVDLDKLKGLLRAGKISQNEYDLLDRKLSEQREKIILILNVQTGNLPLPDLRARYPAN